jgi:predicted amidohydrolase YtcJ
VETVYFNGNIHTLNRAKPIVEALSADGGCIAEMGSSSELFSRAASGVGRIDLRGRTVIPALTDAHAHLLAYAEASTWLSLEKTSAPEELLGALSARFAGGAAGFWILGRGWDQNRWPDPRYPNRALLDAIAPKNPVYLVRVCGHAAFVNSTALGIAGITRDTADPVGGRVLKDASGEPTGILLDTAMELVASRIPTLTTDDKKKLLVAAARECLALGLVGVHEMGMSADAVSLYRELYETDELPFRVTGYLSPDDRENERFLESGVRPTRGGGLLRIVGVKFYADGSLGARSAALLGEYSDEPGNGGILMRSPEELYREILPWYESGFQSAVHAIGDAAVREALDVYERLGAAHPGFDMRNRVEHAQIVSAPDVRRFSALGVVPSVQFAHCTSDMSWVEARLGPERIKGAYAWRSLISAGARVCGGSDFPVESPNPLLGIHSAVTRQDAAGNPAGGWRPEERLTVEEAVRAFTVDAAHAAHAERFAGSLAPGKFADFIVLSEDIFSVEPQEIPDIQVIATVLGGELRYASDTF